MKGLIMGAFLCLLTATTPEVNEFTYDEAQLMMRTAQAEAGNQGEDGMWLVMSCIVNRVNSESEDFPDTIYEVCHQKGQFSTVESGLINKVELSPECRTALARIDKGEVAEPIVAFENKRSKSLDKYFSEVFCYRDHRFYTPLIH